jgi:hypothetical protein
MRDIASPGKPSGIKMSGGPEDVTQKPMLQIIQAKKHAIPKTIARRD